MLPIFLRFAFYLKFHSRFRPSSRSSQVAHVEKDSAKTTHTNHTTSKARFHKVANRGKIFHIKKSKSNDIKPTTNDEAITANLDKADAITANVVNLESTEEVVQQEDDNNNMKEKEEKFEDMNSNSTDERHSNSSGEEKGKVVKIFFCNKKCFPEGLLDSIEACNFLRFKSVLKRQSSGNN